jgi:hypothetical protein
VSSIVDNRSPFRNPANLTAAERLSDRHRWRELPWAARRLARRHGLRPMMAKAIAESIGLPMKAR